MRAAFSLSGATRHGVIALAEGLIVAGIIATLLLALSPIYAPARLISGTDQTYAAKGGNGNGNAGASGGGNSSGVIAVQEPVAWGGTTTATVNPGGTDVYVFVQCYTPDFNGEYVYAAYFPVDGSNQAVIGPLWSTLWMSGGASCRAQEGYFTRNGFGKWVVEAETTFTVLP